MSVVKNKSRKEVEHSLKHIKLVIDMFESNNKILSEPENTLFIIVYSLLACMAGKGMLTNIKGEGLLQSWIINHGHGILFTSSASNSLQSTGFSKISAIFSLLKYDSLCYLYIRL